MRDAVGLLAERENVLYEEALTRFAESKVYDALFDYGTGVWREDSDHLYPCMIIAGKQRDDTATASTTPTPLSVIKNTTMT